MQTSLEKPSTLERRLTVEIPEQQIAGEVQSRLDELRKSVRLDGFRQGKAPAAVIKQRFGKRVREEIVGELLQRSFGEALDKEALRPAGQPVIDPVTSEPGNGLTYTASFEVFPEIELAPVEQVQIKRCVCEIGDADIDAMIEKLREQNRDWLAVERPAQDGDRLTIDFEGTIDGEVFKGGKGEDFDIELGSAMMIDGFEDGLRGRTAGDSVELDLQFPADYRNDELAGKPVKFAITVKKVAEPVLPTLDAGFMEKFGVQGGELEAFRSEVRANMEKERDRTLRQRFNNEVMDKLAAANDFEVPAALVKSESERLREQVARDLIMRGINPADAAGEFDRRVGEQALKRVKLGLLMAEIIKDASLRADPAKVRQMIEEMAGSYEDPAAVVKWYYDNPQQLQQVEGICLEDEVVNWVAERAQVIEESTTFDALMNPVQTDETVEASS
ncbi:MAG: trigger factor [Gammaproteobacteria bacterium]|nr:trigger factor [Gammaproteobacteria bacterium]